MCGPKSELKRIFVSERSNSDDMDSLVPFEALDEDYYCGEAMRDDGVCQVDSEDDVRYGN